MRFPAALSAASAWLFLAGLASAQTPDSASPDAAPAPAPVPAPAASSAPAPASTSTAAPASAAIVVVPNEPDQPQLEPIPSAHDTLSKHFVLGGAAGAKWGFGSLSDGNKQRYVTATGLALNLDLGVGLSRNVVLGLWGEFDDYSAPSECPACTATSIAGGPFIRYHVVQGTRFDPWGSIALGLRQTKVDRHINVGTADYVGPDWLRLQVGGDWYPLANVGFGPYIEFDVGAYNRHPRASTVDTVPHTGLGTGLRIVLDFPGK